MSDVVFETSIGEGSTEVNRKPPHGDCETLLPASASWFNTRAEGVDVDENKCAGDQSFDNADAKPLHGSRESLHVLSDQVASTQPSPSWQDLSCEVIPCAARELLSAALSRLYHTAHLGYTIGCWQRRYCELGNNAAGYYRPKGVYIAHDRLSTLPPFSSLGWVERQLVREWRTYSTAALTPAAINDDVEDEFETARVLAPKAADRPIWRKTDSCFSCHKIFGPGRLRHHCRLCGNSFCRFHSVHKHKLPHLGYHPDVPERVCDDCKVALLDHDLAERVAWRLTRCRDFEVRSLAPYFETGVDTMEKMIERITRVAITMAKSIPLGAQATVAVETIDVLRKYGLNGIYTIMMRQDFLAAADLLQKALGINQTAWPLSVHELSAAIFYALAQHRAIRGLHPEQEHESHTGVGLPNIPSSPFDEAATQAVCPPISDELLSELLVYAPFALNFIYADKEVDMQLLAAQQGWRLLYSLLEQKGHQLSEEPPASAVFVHDDKKLVCLAVRGTTTIQDVVTDIRQVPLPFPEEETDGDNDWFEVKQGQGLAVCGMATAAAVLYREHREVLLRFLRNGFHLRLTGHSLGGSVASLLGMLLLREVEADSNIQFACSSHVRVFSYGTPPCVDSKLSQYSESFITSVVLHDDAVPRLTSLSCRELLKHLLQIRETWVKEHLPNDIQAITTRAKTVWAPRWRGSFTLPTSSSLNKYYRRQYQFGKNRLLSIKEKISKDPDDESPFPSQSLPPFDTSSPEVGARVDIGCTSLCSGITIEGDHFYDAGSPSLLDCSQEDEFNDAFQQCQGSGMSVATMPEGQHDVPEDSGSKEALDTVILQETPLPNMYLPGKVVHIYAHRGVYRATFVPRTFPEVRRISLAGNMLSDHTCKAYYEALIEVRDVRRATEAPPYWTAFDEDSTW